MKVLVTGAGFIGSHLREYLLERGHSVKVIDDLSTGRHENVSHLEGKEGCELIIDMVLNGSLFEEMTSPSTSSSTWHLRLESILLFSNP